MGFVDDLFRGPGVNAANKTKETIDPVSDDGTKEEKKKKPRYISDPTKFRGRTGAANLSEFETQLGGVSEDFLSADFGAGNVGTLGSIDPETGLPIESTGMFGISDKIGTAAAGLTQGTGEFGTEGYVPSVFENLGTSATGIGTAAGDVRGIAGSFMDISKGGEIDPETGKPFDTRFEDFRNAQFDQLNYEQDQQKSMTSDFFARRGLGGSSASLNQLSNVGDKFGRHRSTLGAQLGLQQMQRQDQALQTAAGLYGQEAGILGAQAGIFGQQAGVLGQQGSMYGQQADVFGNALTTQAGLQQQAFDQQSVGLEALTLPYTLDTARIAAGGDPIQDLQDEADAEKAWGRDKKKKKKKRKEKKRLKKDIKKGNEEMRNIRDSWRI